mgnify:CR=1 FL=1
MTTLKATVKRPRGDGFYTVYIRVTHQRKSSYIKTNKIVDEVHIAKNGELTDRLSMSIALCSFGNTPTD